MDANIPNQPVFQPAVQAIVDTTHATQDLLKQIEAQNRANDALFADYAVRINGTHQPK